MHNKVATIRKQTKQRKRKVELPTTKPVKPKRQRKVAVIKPTDRIIRRALSKLDR